MQQGRISSSDLVSALGRDLPDATMLSLNRGAPKPARVVLSGVGLLYLYLWNLTASRPGTHRPEGEMRVQIKVPGYRVGARQSLAHDDAPTFLVGFSMALGVYCLWDARQRPFPAYSANLQATRAGCDEARKHGLTLEVVGHSRSAVRWRLYARRDWLRACLLPLIDHVCRAAPEEVPEGFRNLSKQD